MTASIQGSHGRGRERRLAAQVVLALAVTACGLAVTACGGKELPPQLPTSGAEYRAATRIELVDLVIGDPARAARVRAIYREIELQMQVTKRAEAEELRALGRAQCPRSPDETRALFRRFREAEESGLERYVALQLELRRATTPEEFARLEAIQ